ncbi:MAG: energy transducer TonB [Gemmatimonadetes bacterium]|nr:energy transducer TonB [Gemmatimonadota bacterium]MYI67002.1 energy transducer TonB [Gemmatimonadota bacterium]
MPMRRRTMRNQPSYRPDLNVPVEGLANERFKRSFSSWFWGSITAAAVLHFVIFAYFPSMAVAAAGSGVTITEVVNIPPDVDIPPPPDALRRPAQPVISAVLIDDVLPLAPNTILGDGPGLPPPPKPTAAETVPDGPGGFVVHTLKPKMLNQDEVNRVLEREYPALLKDAGIGGKATVWLFIDEEGVVRDQRVKESSGHAGLDAAALKVVTVARFSPAKNRDKTVALWIALDITFKANQQSVG